MREHDEYEIKKIEKTSLGNILGNQALLSSSNVMQRVLAFTDESVPSDRAAFLGNVKKAISAIISEKIPGHGALKGKAFNTIFQEAQKQYDALDTFPYKSMNDFISKISEGVLAAASTQSQSGPKAQEVGAKREQAARAWLNVEEPVRKRDPDAKTFEEQPQHAVKLDIGDPNPDGTIKTGSHIYYGIVGGAAKAGRTTGDEENDRAEEQIKLTTYTRLLTDLSLVSMEHNKMPLAFVAIKNAGHPGPKEQKVIETTKRADDVQLVEMHDNEQDEREPFEFRTDLNHTLTNILDILDRINFVDQRDARKIYHLLMGVRVRLIFFEQMVQREIPPPVFLEKLKPLIDNCQHLLDLLLDSFSD